GVLVAIPFVADAVVIWNYVERWREQDTTDYDFMNPPAGDAARAPAAPDNTSPSKLRKLFRREQQRGIAERGVANGSPAPGSPAGSDGLDQLEKAESEAAPPSGP